MSISTQKLPSMEEFKIEAKQLKITGNFEKLGHAQNALARKFGFKDFNSIRTRLKEKDSLFNKLPSKITTYKLSNGGLVNSQGLYKTKEGYSTSADASNSYTPKKEVEKALYFIDNVLEKRKTINLNGSSSYGLKHHAEAYITHYKLFDSDYYISNAAFIIALDIRGYEIKELMDDMYYSLNIKTNYKSFRGNFYDKLDKGDFDYTRKNEFGLPIFSDVRQIEKYGYKDSVKIPTPYLNILENRRASEIFNNYLAINIFHRVKSMQFINEKGFYFEVNKKDIFGKFSYIKEQDNIILKKINDDMFLVNRILGINPNVFYDELLENFVVYWENKNNKIKLKKEKINESYLLKNKYFHLFNDNGKSLEYHGEIDYIKNDVLHIKYVYDDRIYTISIDDLDNFVFYNDSILRDKTHRLINEASRIENHRFFNTDLKGYKLAKEFITNNKQASDFIFNKICDTYYD